MPPVRVAIVDIGTNSTRLLVADVSLDGHVSEIVRRSTVTRLGEGVDASGELAAPAMDRVFAVLSDYRRAIDEHRAQANLAVLTSAVRDATNGAQFTARVRADFGLDARTLAGDEEAALTFLGATSERDESDEPIVVIDIGGGSTEFIIGAGRQASFHVSTQAGVVRMSERHIDSDPPRPEELQDLEADTHSVFLAALPAAERARVTAGIAVAGTATSAAAIELELEPYDPARVHGHQLLLASVELLLARLADMTDAERRQIAGLQPDRAPTIVAGMILLAESMRAFGLDGVEVSEHDILRGGALRLAGLG